MSGIEPTNSTNSDKREIDVTCLATLQSKLSDFALELKPAPKNTCIPGQRRNFFSETNISTLDGKHFEPDKSWSVLFFSAKDKEMKTNL